MKHGERPRPLHTWLHAPNMHGYLYCSVYMPLSCQYRRPGKRKLSGPLLRGNARTQRGRPLFSPYFLPPKTRTTSDLHQPRRARPVQPRRVYAPARAPPSASCSTSERQRVHVNYYSVYVAKACTGTRIGEASGGCAELRKLFPIPFYSFCSVSATEPHTNIMFSV